MRNPDTSINDWGFSMAYLIRRKLTRRSFYGSRIYNLKSETWVWYRLLRTIEGTGIKDGFITFYSWCVLRAKRNRWHTNLTARMVYGAKSKLNPRSIASINRMVYAFDRGIMEFEIEMSNGRGGKTFITDTMVRPYLPAEHVMYRDDRLDELMQDWKAMQGDYKEFVKRQLSKIKSIST